MENKLALYIAKGWEIYLWSCHRMIGGPPVDRRMVDSLITINTVNAAYGSTSHRIYLKSITTTDIVYANKPRGVACATVLYGKDVQYFTAII